ncbi:MAG: YeeE/YedE thiosulfate transporter family protein [Bacillota bacterium]
MVIALVSLAVGLLVGYLAQRSRLCFVGGLRDFLLIRDTDLLKGAAAFFLAAWLAFPLVSLMGGRVWEAAQPAPNPVVAVTAAAPVEAPSDRPFRPWLPAAAAVVAGLGLGAASTLANGCPMRQHVLAAQGSRDSWYYLAGFYVGAVLYHQTVQPWLAEVLP